MKRVMFGFLFIVLMIGLVFAAQGNFNLNNLKDCNEDNDCPECSCGIGVDCGACANPKCVNNKCVYEIEDDLNLQNQEKIRAGDYNGENGQQMRIQEQSNNRIRLEIGGVNVDCDCNMTQERVQNQTKLYIELSNGRNAEIKIMPNTASETALKRLRLINCIEEEGCRIELKEVGQGEGARLAYEMKTQKQAKVFGLFRARMQVRAQVDAETGEIIRVKKPWWAFLASEPEE